MLGKEQMETPTTSTKESVLLQQWTCSFSFGLSSQYHIEYSWFFGGWLFFFTMSTGSFQSRRKTCMQSLN